MPDATPAAATIHKENLENNEGMRTIADTPLCSVVGLVVLAAMFLTIWVARDSSAGADLRPAPASVETTAQPQTLGSGRTHHAPVTHTSIPPERFRQSQGK